MPFPFSGEPVPGIEKDAPPAMGLKLLFRILSREFFPLIRLSCLFLLFSIPIVTIPAAYCAMTRITVDMVRDRPYFLWHDFFAAFRSELGMATAAGLLLSVGITATAFAAYFYYGQVEAGSLYILPFGVAVLVLAWLLLMGLSVFPMLALVDLPLKNILKNALLLVPLSFGRLALSLAACAFLLFAALWFFPVSLIPALLLCPALFSLLTVFGAYDGIERYVIAERREPEED